MRIRGSFLLSLAVLAAVAVGAFLALAPTRGDAQEDDRAVGTTRYRVTVVRLAVPPESHGEPLTLADLGGDAPGALVPAARSPGAAGHLGALPDRPDLIAKIGAKGTAYEVIFRGEAESVVGKNCSIQYGQRFPIQTTDIRGNQNVVTTKFEKVGFKLKMERMLDTKYRDVHNVQVEVSSVSATRNGLTPIIFEVSAQGMFRLPDGYTAIFSYLDRVEGFCFANSPESIAAGTESKEMPADIVMQYFVLVTRLDLK